MTTGRQDSKLVTNKAKSNIWEEGELSITYGKDLMVPSRLGLEGRMQYVGKQG